MEQNLGKEDLRKRRISFACIIEVDPPLWRAYWRNYVN
jgi:hypothetical protein